MHDVDLTNAGVPESAPVSAPASEPVTDDFAHWLNRQSFNQSLAEIAPVLIELHQQVRQGSSQLDEPALVTAAQLIRLRLLGESPAIEPTALEWSKKLARVLARKRADKPTPLLSQLAQLLHQSALYTPDTTQGPGDYHARH
ncbi:hypothetical protein [Simiduia agarivorans]|nr:hypothetical protein [Simiduia agarivorans]